MNVQAESGTPTVSVLALEQSRIITFGNTILKMQYRIWDHDVKNLAALRFYP